MLWAPSLQIFLSYSYVTDIIETTHFAVYSQIEGDLTITKKIVMNNTVKLPYLTYLTNNFKSNVFEYRDVVVLKYKLFIYIYNYNSKLFEPLFFEMSKTIPNLSSDLNKGLTNMEREYISDILGKCLIEIKVKSIIRLIIIEFSDPFYLFQLFSFTLWFFFETYTIYAVAILVLTLMSVTIGIYESISNLNNIKSIAENSCLINRLDKFTDSFEKVDSTLLSPGDIIEIPDIGTNIPCDCILLDGLVVLNESVLTGESVPVVKSEISDTKEDILFDIKQHPSLSKHLIYTGTKVVLKKILVKDIHIIESKVLALVYKTGFNSEKGNLIRSILNPKDHDIEFKKESVIYILCLLALVLVLDAIVIPLMSGTTARLRIVRFCDLITIGVPPALPACLSVGIGFAIWKLKKRGILCVKREKTNISGQVDHIIFDKTGTLTVDHLEEYGNVGVKLNLNNVDSKSNLSFERLSQSSKINGNNVFSNKLTHYEYTNLIHEFNKSFTSTYPKLELNYLKEECLATCNSLQLIDYKLIGDPIEKEMINGVKWEIANNQDEIREKNDSINYLNIVTPSNSLSIRIGIVKTFEFVNKLQRMTVITKYISNKSSSSKSSHFKVYTKGSPEVMKTLCNPLSIPKNFEEELHKYTYIGLRVLALAFKLVKFDNQNDISYYNRNKAEKDLIFLGFYVVYNKLKHNTSEEMVILKNCNYKVTMATGDNILTASYIAKKCNLTNKKILAMQTKSNTEEIEMLEYDPNKNINNTKLNSIDDNMKSGNTHNTEKESLLEIYDNTDISINNEVVIGTYYEELNDEIKCIVDSLLKVEVIKDKKNQNSYIYKLEDSTSISLEKSILDKKENHFENDKPDSIFISDKHSVHSEVENKKMLAKLQNYLDKIDTQLNDIQLTFAINGVLFETIVLVFEYINSNEVYRIEYKEMKDKLLKLINKTSVFARMTPDNKTKLIQIIQEYNKEIVLMCGDGANDCGALKAAQVGLSFSIEEASIAAPFTSTINDISTVKILLIEGKASITTSFHCFKFMIMYSVIVLIAGTILTACRTYLTDNQFIIVDIFLVLPYSVLISCTDSNDELNKEKPVASLFSFQIILSLVSQIFLTLFVMINSVLILRQFRWYIPEQYSISNSNIYPGYNNTVRMLF